ncbi:hypothetical protein UlMin_009266 [Ulmus minor]
MAEPVAKGVSIGHIARESNNVKRLANFYKEIFGFEEIESPDFGEMEVIWLNLPSAFCLHIIERNPNTKLPASPWSSDSPVLDPSHLPSGHHICFSASNFDSIVEKLKEKGIETFQKSLPNGKVKQVFFFDPDGNGLEIASREE